MLYRLVLVQYIQSLLLVAKSLKFLTFISVPVASQIALFGPPCSRVLKTRTPSTKPSYCTTSANLGLGRWWGWCCCLLLIDRQWLGLIAVFFGRCCLLCKSFCLDVLMMPFLLLRNLLLLAGTLHPHFQITSCQFPKASLKGSLSLSLSPLRWVRSAKGKVGVFSS